MPNAPGFPMPKTKPASRTKKKARYYLDLVLPDAGFSIKRYQLWFKGYRGELCMKPVLARRICKLLNAQKGSK